MTCLAHPKEHFKTSFAEYWRWCTVGQVTSRSTYFSGCKLFVDYIYALDQCVVVCSWSASVQLH